LKATAFGSICIQTPQSWNTVENKDKMSEDCLFLNVVAPPQGAEPSRPLPVVVYFHAGEFSVGAACDLESDQPWSDDVILVTPASRLGLFGYLGAADLRGRTSDGSTGSYGVEDQREALRWVQANIAAFGGNASNVAIMGESSGGAAVGVHLTLNKSWGLFHKAIGESPGLTQVKSLEDAELNYQYVLGALLALKSPGCVHDDSDEASYATFEHTELQMSDYGPSGHSSSVLESHVGWDYKQAAAACGALPNCHGFNILVTAANTTVYLVNTTKLFDVTVRSALPAGQSVTAYLKAAAGGAKGVQCLVQADAKVLMQGINSYAPRADTFQTDTWAPVLDGVAFKRSIIDSIVAGNVAPGVPLLAGSNMDEGTIFMGLVPTIRCNASADDFLAWANAFYGPTLGPLVPPAYAALRQPVPWWRLREALHTRSTLPRARQSARLCHHRAAQAGHCALLACVYALGAQPRVRGRGPGATPVVLRVTSDIGSVSPERRRHQGCGCGRTGRGFAGCPCGRHPAACAAPHGSGPGPSERAAQVPPL
jgi:hypothetical protein